MSRRTLDTDQVVSAAAALADEEGLDAVTLTRVANQLGVRQPALYRHVDSYDALVRLLGLRGREILAERGYDLADDEQVHAAGTLRAAFHGFAHLEAGDGFPQPQDTDDTFGHLLDLVCDGIRPLVAR